MYAFLALLIGALTAVMIVLNGVLAAHLGNALASALIHLTGLILIIPVLLLTRAKSPFQPGIPSWLLSGGAIGFLTVVFASQGFLKLGVSLTLALGLLGQTVSAVVMDHFGWLGAAPEPFERKKLVSLAFISAGIIVMGLG